MKKILIFLAICMCFSQKIFAQEIPQCPTFSEISLTADEVITKIDECIAARNTGNSASITDFYCPAGEYSLEDNKPLTSDRIAYHITVNLFFNESDKKMKEYMENLNKIRSKNPTAWMYEYNSCIYGKGKETKKSLSYFYSDICSFTFVSDFLNKNSHPDRKFMTNTDWYPQIMCQKLADKKKKAWENLGSALMTQGIYKSYQNDRDYYMEGIQGQYRSIIEKFHNYQKIIFRASSKITHYIREAVK